MKRDFFVLAGLFIAAWVFLAVWDPNDEGDDSEEDTPTLQTQIEESPRESKDLSRELISTLRYKHISNENSDIVKALSEIENKLSSDEVEFKLYMDNSKEVNLFALPSNMIVISRGLLKMIDNAEQLAALVCHGIGHLKYNHSIAELENSLKIAVIHSEMGSAFDEAHTVLNNHRYTVDMESEAEGYAIELMNEKGISPKALSNFYSKLYKQADGVPNFLHTHKGADGRIKSLNDATESSTKISFSFDWDEVKKKL